MKKLLTALFTIAISLQMNAQYDPEALAILDAMSANYKKVEAFTAEFTIKLTNESADLEDSQAGKIAVKGEKFVVDISGQKVFNNGTDIFTYNAEINEVTIASNEPDDEEISINNVYDLYKKGFKYALMSTIANGDRIIELDPESRDKSYFKIRMVINAKDELKSFTVFERTGNKYLYSINSFKPTSLSDNYFTFDPSKYPNVEVIDFR